MSARRPAIAAAALALALAAGPLAAGCRAIDHKYWSLPVTTTIEEASWKERWPRTNTLLRTLACVFCDSEVIAEPTLLRLLAID